MPKISIVTPVYDMKDKNKFLERLSKSIDRQNFKDFEWVISENGKGMAANTNEGINRAKGDILKIIFMDDYFAHDNSLLKISETFEGRWLVTACEHDNGTRGNPHYAWYNEEIHTGNNTIGSPSVLAFENEDPLLFDESLTWMLDCDLYKRLYDRYGVPTVLDDINVVIGIGEHQMTNLIDNETKIKETNSLIKKYA